MLNRLKERYRGLDPARQKRITQLVVVGIFVVVSLVGYQVKRSGRPVPPREVPPVEDLQPSLGYLQKSLYYETKSKMGEMEDQLKQLELRLKTLNTRLGMVARKQEKKVNEENRGERQAKTISSPFGASTQLNRIIRKKAQGTPPYPPPPAARASAKPVQTGPQQRQAVLVGAIGESKAGQPAPAPRKKKARGKGSSSVYLPPSFMDADLISGFAAPTMEAAKSEPVRVFLRIRDLAVLPNRVKGDLKGCFAIAEAYGNLADERAHLRLLRLSCVARDGSSVIDEGIKGFVVDEDGRIGLKGRVVTKMGSFLARSMAAAFLQGFGNAYAYSGFTVNTSGIGQTSTLNPGEAFKAGIGKGISEGARGLSRFYLDLARQTFPVIEVGAGKMVTIVIDEGVELKIRKKCLGGKDGCEDTDNPVSVLDRF